LGPVRTVPEAFDCEQAVHRGMVEELDHPVAGKIRLPRSPISYTPKDEASSHTASKHGSPPMLGEHTEEVLRDILNIPVDMVDVRRLESEGVVECWPHDEDSPSSKL
jgi:crotonobetainyl-CoA:carnitine CoA-transferase CaiB-like acyl-CoA transferase